MSVLSDADETINGPRESTYGSPGIFCSRVATLWTGYFMAKGHDITITPSDIPLLMTQFKMARLMTDPGHRDSVEDMAGYAGIYARVRGLDA